MRKPVTLIVGGATLMFSACSKPSSPESTTQHAVVVELHGKLQDGREVKLYTLTNKGGMVAKVSEYGAILDSLMVPDSSGALSDVTLGYDSLEGWLTNTSYFGATVGRYGNRIAEGKFALEGKEYALATNNAPGDVPCHLHGGEVGFDKVLWSGESSSEDGSSSVTLTYVSKDGEEGYPGELTTKVTYTLTDENELIWEATAKVEGSATPINVVHHSYWNLSGSPESSINDHLLTLPADAFLPTNAGLIPTGELQPVAGTPFDFTEATAIGDRVEEENEALKFGGGYDHCWVLREESNESGLRPAAVLEDPKSGRKMEILTNQPGIQFYGGNFLDGTVEGKGGVKYPFRSGLCLETQVFPDSPNQPSFPSCILKPGEEYEHVMIHRFSW